MAQFLLDMGVPPKLVSFLRDKGYPTVHANDLGLSHASDRVLLDYAIAHDLILLTTDLGFSKIVALEGIVAPGLIIMRLDNPSVEAMTSHLNKLVSNVKIGEMRGMLVIVEPHRLRKRKLPIIPER